MNSGIYAIKCKVNNKIYIGCTIDFEKRWKTHKIVLNKNYRYCNKYLREDWILYGEENFEFVIIEKCNKESFKEREQYWIDSFNSLNKDTGYNIHDSSGAVLASEETKLKQSISQKNARKRNPKNYIRSKKTNELFRQNLLKEYENNPDKNKGINNPMFGRKQSEETKKKISDALKLRNKKKNRR